MSLPADFWNLPAFTGLAVADQTALETSATDMTFAAHQTLATDHNDVAVLLTGRAVLSRDGVVERVVEAPSVLDLTEPAIGAHPSFFTLEPGQLVFLPRVKVEAVVSWITLRESAMEQIRDERTDLSELVDRQTWVWPDSPSLPSTPYAGELDYVALVVDGMPGTWPLPPGATRLSTRVLVIIGMHTGGTSGSSVLPPGVHHGQAWLWVPILQGGVERYHVAQGWTDHLTVLHLMRELYGLQLIEGRVFDGYSLDGRLLAFSETLRWRTELALGPSASMSDLAGETGVPWTSDEVLPLSFGFRKDPFGVGPALARPCVADMNLAFTLVDELDLAYTTATSVDGNTLAGGAIVAGFRITGTFVLQLPAPATSPWMDRLRAWGIG